MTQMRGSAPKFKKGLGQNFLRDPNIAVDIARALPVDVPVLEIGPGDGFLTKQLLETDHRVIGVEIDKDWFHSLKRRLKGHSQFTLISANILKLDWDNLACDVPEINIAGNLPYHLTSPAIFTIFDRVRYNKLPKIKHMVVMIQDEVGKRLTADPGNKQFGGVSLLARFHADVSYLFSVPADRFFPKPRVNGAVVKFDFKEPDELPNIDYYLFQMIIKNCFSQRRKMMKNTLGKLQLPCDWQTLDYDFTLRPERFDFESFVSLTKDITALMES